MDTSSESASNILLEKVTSIVNVTPVPLSHDSRTLKQALTFERLGLKSVVIADGQLLKPGEVAVTGSGAETANNTSPAPTRETLLRRIWRAVRTRDVPAPIQALAFIGWFGIYSYRWVFRIFPILPNASVYILHEFSQFPAIWLKARLNGAKIIYDAHDFYTQIEDDRNKSSFDRKWLLPFSRAVEQACVRRAARVWTVSSHVASLLKDAYGIKAEVIRNLHDPRLDQLTTNNNENDLNLRGRLKLSPSDFLLVTIGNCKPGQAIETALDSLQRLPNSVHLVFIGAGYDRHWPEIIARKLEQRVHLIGRLPAPDIVPMARSANAGLILYYPRSTNYVGALPNGFFQCVAAKLPVIVPDLPEIAALVKQYQIGMIINTREVNEMTAAILSLSNDRAKADIFATHSAIAAAELSWVNEEKIMLGSLLSVFGVRDK